VEEGRRLKPRITNRRQRAKSALAGQVPAELGGSPLERKAICPALTSGTLPLKHVRPICSVDKVTARLQTFHSVRQLSVIGATYSAMPAAALVVPIDETHLCSFGRARDKPLHRSTRPLQFMRHEHPARQCRVPTSYGSRGS